MVQVMCPGGLAGQVAGPVGDVEDEEGDREDAAAHPVDPQRRVGAQLPGLATQPAGGNAPGQQESNSLGIFHFA